MKLEIVSYSDLVNPEKKTRDNPLKKALYEQGIVGVSNVPCFLEVMHAYIKAVREFSALSEEIKKQYAPQRDKGDTEGYELGAERFKDSNGNWQVDNKKSSFYAFVPDHNKNKWPREVDLKTPYLKLGQLIFQTGKHVLNYIGLNDDVGISHHDLVGYGRMLHYHQESDVENTNPNWCGNHFDHGILTGLAPAYYFKEGMEIEEPDEAGLFIIPTKRNDFVKVNSLNKSILLFQVGEFGQLATHDAICATQHVVRKAKEKIERFTFALFFGGNNNTVINSQSELTKDTRYANNMNSNGSIGYRRWKKFLMQDTELFKFVVVAPTKIAGASHQYYEFS